VNTDAASVDVQSPSSSTPSSSSGTPAESLAEWIVKSSDVVGLFLETGAGCPLVSALYDVPGASRAIVGSLQPYDRAFAGTMFGEGTGIRKVYLASLLLLLGALLVFGGTGMGCISVVICLLHMSLKTTENCVTKDRAVSIETVQAFLTALRQQYQPHHPKVNTLVATSFQLGWSAETRTHGFVGISYKDRTSVYHVSLFEPDWPRSRQIRALGDIGLQLLRWHVGRFGSGEAWEARLAGLGAAPAARIQVDQLCEVELQSGRQAANAKALLDFDYPVSTQDLVLLFRPDGTADRLDALLRDKEHLVVFKGSFNPVTRKHEAILKETLPSEASVERVFMISVDTVDKGRVSNEALLERIRHLNRIGYACLVNRRGTFSAAIELLHHRFPRAQLHFPIGQDTRDRMEPALFEPERYPNVHWHTYPRTPCSSTRVRELLSIRAPERTPAQCNELRELVPPALWQSLGVASWTS
jgi:hypothetical protein